jgi:hypothetical protein
MPETNNTLYCTFHPKTETQLRCNRCNQLICIKCATHTPTGYRCPECIKTQQKVFVTTRWFDPAIAAVISGLLSYLGSLFTFIAFYSFILIFIAVGAGMLIVWAVKKAIRNRRSPVLKYVMSAAALLGGLIPVAGSVLQNLRYYGVAFAGGIYGLIWDLAYAVIVAAYVYYQLRN